jgi:uncharacterized protein YyaL (SSP411 family)
MTNNNGVPNRLSKEKSPYLLQHQFNPVDWFPWGQEAFEKAKAEDKPIFLSIGYSTCHWCHVMERESFEDKEVADLLNRYFVAVKVDREERPDIDNIYMTVCQALTGHGGWPLTIFMTPDKKPFFAGTYFPKKGRMGMPGLMDILNRVADLWKGKREELIESADKIMQAIQADATAAFYEKGRITKETIKKGYEHLNRSFDPRYGGFGRAPKFPIPHNLLFLLRYWKLNKTDKALEMVKKTLNAMHRGGIYDHIGFGFSRYSTDNKWLVPHFEKMLYDNALLAMAYLEAYQATGAEEYRRVAREIFTYVLRDMTSEEGAFYSAEDADSEGVEGKFYVWDKGEVTSILSRERGERFCRLYDITQGGNFEGKSIPNLIDKSEEEVQEALSLEEDRKQLYEYRNKRVHPYKDDKVLTAWNGLMIAALSMGARILGQNEYAQAAQRAVAFILDKLRRQDGRLLARYRDKEAAFPAYVDDYAFLILGLIEFYETTYDPYYLEKALELNDDMIHYFWDNDRGGLFLYGKDGEQLITRPKEVYDGAMPSGNSVAALNFLRLARLTGNEKLEKKAEQQLQYFSAVINESPAGYTYFLMAAMFALYPTKEIVVVGDKQRKIPKRWFQSCIANTCPWACPYYTLVMMTTHWKDWHPL